MVLIVEEAMLKVKELALYAITEILKKDKSCSI